MRKIVFEDRLKGSRVAASRAARRFTLPQICTCGAHGKITFEPRRPPGMDESDPDPAIVAVEGPFQIDDGEALVCLSCGERIEPRSA